MLISSVGPAPIPDGEEETYIRVAMFKIGRAAGARTRGLMDPIHALCQLSYSPMSEYPSKTNLRVAKRGRAVSSKAKIPLDDTTGSRRLDPTVGSTPYSDRIWLEALELALVSQRSTERYTRCGACAPRRYAVLRASLRGTLRSSPQRRPMAGPNE